MTASSVAITSIKITRDWENSGTALRECYYDCVIYLVSAQTEKSQSSLKIQKDSKGYLKQRKKGNLREMPPLW